MKGISKEGSSIRIGIIALAIALSLPAIALTNQYREHGRDLSEKFNGRQLRDADSDRDDDEEDEGGPKKDKGKGKLEREQDKREKQQKDKQQRSERKDDDDDDDKDDDKDEDDDGDKDDDEYKDDDDSIASARATILAEAGPQAGSSSPANLSSTAAVLAVTATIETAPVPSVGDAADDPAIWVNPKDRSQSTIIGSNKQGGLAVYALDGKQLQYLPDGLMNNVDLRAGFSLGRQKVAIVAAGNRADNSIAIYRVNPSTRMLENVVARKITTIATYGCCLYRSQKTGKFYYIVTSKSGEAEQWELLDNGDGKVDAKTVRRFKVGTQLEGCVADDKLGYLYIGEEAVGIWKYGAEPDAGESRVQVDKAGPGGNLVADVEGLTIAHGKDGKGYLIASSQGNNTYVIYKREKNNAYVKTFSIAAGSGIDGVEDTDGIDVTMANLGPAFPQGVFVAQDGINDKGNQNFKLVPFHSIMKGR